MQSTSEVVAFYKPAQNAAGNKKSIKPVRLIALRREKLRRARILCSAAMQAVRLYFVLLDHSTGHTFHSIITVT